jgi:hypothetical protein
VAAYNEHLISLVHELPDVVNVYSGPAATDLDTIQDMLTSVETGFDNHIVGYSWHREAPGESYDLPAYGSVPSDPIAAAIASMNELQSMYNAHVQASRSHAYVDPNHLLVLPPAIDVPSLVLLCNGFKTVFNEHITNGGDGGNAASISVSAGVVTVSGLSSVSPLYVGGDITITGAASPTNNGTFEIATYISPTSITVINTQAINGDVNNGNITWALSGVASVDHVLADSFNVVTAANASDLESAGALIQQEVASFNAHRTQIGVHGTSVFVRLDPPSGVLYQGMNFYPVQVGDLGQTSPFSDDESTFIGVFVPPL